MKKILSTLVVLATLSSCGSDTYTITGVVDGAVDGDSVTLGYSPLGDDLVIAQKTVIDNGKFRFNGKVDGTKIYYIGYDLAIEPIYLMFFLEGGDINVELTADGGKVTGTPSNDINSKFEEDMAHKVNRIYECQYAMYSDTLMSDSLKSRMELEAYEAQRDAVEYVQGMIRDNITSMMGLYLLVQYAELFEDEEFDKLLSMIPKEHIDRDNNCLYDILVEMQSDRKAPHSSDDIVE